MSLANTGVLPVALLWPCRDFKWLLTPSFIGLVSKHPASPILVMGRSKKFLRRITFLVKQDDELWGGNTRLVNFMHEVDKAQRKLPAF
jgi:hypothetical protein